MRKVFLVTLAFLTLALGAWAAPKYTLTLMTNGVTAWLPQEDFRRFWRKATMMITARKVQKKP